jgi:predicted RecB family endonuclease
VNEPLEAVLDAAAQSLDDLPHVQREISQILLALLEVKERVQDEEIRLVVAELEEMAGWCR